MFNFKLIKILKLKFNLLILNTPIYNLIFSIFFSYYHKNIILQNFIFSNLIHSY